MAKLALPQAFTPVVVAATIALAGCGGDDDAASTEPSKLTITATESGKNVKLAVSGDATPGVADIDFENDGKRPHGAQLIAVTGDRTEAEVVEALSAVTSGKAAPPWFFAAGGPGTADPGETRAASVVLIEGTYFVVDDEDDANFQNGGITEIPVSGTENEAELPSGPTITADDYSLAALGLKSGTDRVTFANAGKEWHHVIAAPIAEGATIKDVEEFAASEGEAEGKPPIDLDDAVSSTVIEGGGSMVVDMDLQKGRYALLCFIPDREGGEPHVAKGMIGEAVVE